MSIYDIVKRRAIDNTIQGSLVNGVQDGLRDGWRGLGKKERGDVRADVPIVDGPSTSAFLYATVIRGSADK